MCMVAVRGDHAVRGANRLTHAGQHSLLADVQMAKSAKFLLYVEVATTFLETAHQQHIAMPLDIRLAAELRRGGLLCSGLGPWLGAGCSHFSTQLKIPT
jgi:hypothetical protein